MASSMNGKDEQNFALWLANRAGKIVLSCPLGTTCCVQQGKFPESHTVNPLLTKLFGQDGSILASFLFFLFMDLNSASQWTRKIKNSTTIQPSWPRSKSITHILKMNDDLTPPNIVLVWNGLINSTLLVNNNWKRLHQGFSFCSVVTQGDDNIKEWYSDY